MSETVLFFAAPWGQPGFRVSAYKGPMGAEVFLPDAECNDWSREAAVQELWDKLELVAREMGCNAVMGVEVNIDPFYENRRGVRGLRIHAVGTAAMVEEARGVPPFF